jgi:HCOMODA/2-hydroxy-3-carboxy-muconic semialdehyde decarboxylase
MSKLANLLDDLVVANRILANENVVDAFGHVSVRHPDRADRLSLLKSLSGLGVGLAMKIETDGF